MVFERTTFQGLDGIPKVRFTLVAEKEFYVEASAAGVKVFGSSEFESIEDYTVLAHTQVAAWREHNRLKTNLKNKLTQNIAGH